MAEPTFDPSREFITQSNNVSYKISFEIHVMPFCFTSSTDSNVSNNTFLHLNITLPVKTRSTKPIFMPQTH